MKWVTVALSLTLLLAVFAIVAFSTFSVFLKDSEADGWATWREVERINFPGGDMVVREIRQTPSDKGYISLSIEANLTSEENMAAYIESRTNALNALLETVTASSSVEAVVTFKDPISPEDFASLCGTSVEKLGEYAIILTDETTNTKSAEVVWFPRPEEAGFIQNITSIKEGYRLEGIVAFECYILTDAARTLQTDPKALLIDPLEDLKMLEIRKNYESKGFYVRIERPFFKETWKQYTQMKTVLEDFQLNYSSHTSYFPVSFWISDKADKLIVYIDY